MNTGLAGLLVCATAATLLSAGLAKLAVPQHTRRVLTELVRMPASTAGALVRLLAVAEVLTAVGLLVPVVRAPAAAGVALLGAAFAVAGITGRRRGTATPCGCFGRGRTRPLGPRHALTGALLVAAGLLVGTLDAATLPPPDQLAPGTAALAVLLVLALWRDVVADLLRLRPTRSTPDQGARP